MVYNRCVGTRFCSNNCPYKVRRFNWFDWVDREPVNQGMVQLQRNPDVTVRERGVMEKCTFCVQRLEATKIRARVDGNRAIREGEVTTACAQACPTRAIQFDSLHNTGSAMVRGRQEPRAFAVLHELGTRPRVHYLARIDNPNPEIT
jgi:molybdopterin-containing oxidoreductase family iron-sulfur binding subunit